jgi:hypothetical protein
MPGRADRHPAVHERRGRQDAAQVLAISLPEVPDQGAMHDRRLLTHHAMGARRCARDNAGAARRCAGGSAATTTDGRARVRDAQEPDGLRSLPDQDVTAGQNLDELAGLGLQLEAGDEVRRNAAVDDRDEGVGREPFLVVGIWGGCAGRLPVPLAGVCTQPRPIAAHRSGRDRTHGRKPLRPSRRLRRASHWCFSGGTDCAIFVSVDWGKAAMGMPHQVAHLHERSRG